MVLVGNNEGLLVIERMATILDFFRLDDTEWSITEIARQTGLNKSVVYRLVHSLELQGFMKKDPETKKYSLGMRFFELGQIVGAGMNLRNIARPIMYDLSHECNLTVILCIVDNLQQVCIEKVDGKNIIRIASQVGARIHLHAGASAKLLLAYLPYEKRVEYYKTYGLPAFTDKTTTDVDKLEEELEEIRQKEYVFTVEERDINLAGIAAPVYNYQGEVVASLTIIGPKWNYDDNTVPKFIKHVKRAANQVSKELGYKKD